MGAGITQTTLAAGYAVALYDVSLAVLLEFSARIGKTAVQARDTPGSIVNRVARPFSGEDAASAAAMRIGARHPAGPIERAEAIGYARVVAIIDHLWAARLGLLA